MTNASIVGIGSTRVGEHWSKSIYELGTEALHLALQDAEIKSVDALIVGNMLSGVLNQQENLAASLAERAGLQGTEAFKVEAACASGSAALKLGIALIAAGHHSRVAVLGVEKLTDSPPAAVTQALAYAADYELESLHGASFSSLGALLTSLYLDRAGISAAELSRFAIHAHQHATQNPAAMFQRSITHDDWLRSPIICNPLRTLDCSPVCDGAAAVILASHNGSKTSNSPSIEILACEGATCSLALAYRTNPLRLTAVETSVKRALKRSGVSHSDIDFFELHDAFPVMAALSLEASGFMRQGEGWKYFSTASENSTAKVPIQTMGGLKGRGHPVGATGVYQIVEACTQLRGDAGQNQVPHAKVAMTQNLGGLAANVFTTILRKSNP